MRCSVGFIDALGGGADRYAGEIAVLEQRDQRHINVGNDGAGGVAAELGNGERVAKTDQRARLHSVEGVGNVKFRAQCQKQGERRKIGRNPVLVDGARVDPLFGDEVIGKRGKVGGRAVIGKGRRARKRQIVGIRNAVFIKQREKAHNGVVQIFAVKK